MSTWGVLDWGGVIKLWRMGHLGKHGLSQIPRCRGGKTWSWFFFFVWRVHSGRLSAVTLRKKKKSRGNLSLLPVHHSQEKLPLTLDIVIFFSLLQALNRNIVKERWFRISLFMRPRGGMRRSGKNSKEEVVVVREGKYRRGSSSSHPSFSLNAYLKNLLRLEAPSRGHLICFPTFRDKTSFCFCNYQGSQQMVPFQKLVSVESVCVCSLQKFRHPQLTPTCGTHHHSLLLAEVTIFSELSCSAFQFGFFDAYNIFQFEHKSKKGLWQGSFVTSKREIDSHKYLFPWVTFPEQCFSRVSSKFPLRLSTLSSTENTATGWPSPFTWPGTVQRASLFFMKRGSCIGTENISVWSLSHPNFTSRDRGLGTTSLSPDSLVTAKS